MITAIISPNLLVLPAQREVSDDIVPARLTTSLYGVVHFMEPEEVHDHPLLAAGAGVAAGQRVAPRARVCRQVVRGCDSGADRNLWMRVYVMNIGVIRSLVS